jgi:hypothetical protein
MVEVIGMGGDNMNKSGMVLVSIKSDVECWKTSYCKEDFNRINVFFIVRNFASFAENAKKRKRRKGTFYHNILVLFCVEKIIKF